MHKVLHHMAEHTWAWVVGITVLGVLTAALRYTTPAAFLFMLVGLLIMMKSEGTSLERIVEEDPLAGAPEEPEARPTEGDRPAKAA